jgi:hypothetical protein
MPDKVAPNKQMMISVGRDTKVFPKSLLAKAFQIVGNQSQEGCIEVLFELEGKSAGCERVVIDGHFIRQNPTVLVTYLAKIEDEADDSSQSENIPYTQSGMFANMIFMGRVGTRAETCFSLLSLHEWGNAVNEAQLATDTHKANVDAKPVLSVYSTVAFQKKLLSEILTVLKVA